MSPLVSILIPAYKSERWLAETLRSALAQTWSNTEIIVVDDGSPDNTLAVARSFESAKVKVVTQENQGAPAARNHAFALCQGEYVMWLDADDLISPDKVALQVHMAQALDNPRLVMSCVWGYFAYRAHRATFPLTALCEDLSPAEWLTRKLESNMHQQTATWLVSRKVTEAAGPWDPTLISDDDGEYFCRVLLASEGVRFTPGAKVYYRVTPTGSWGDLTGSRRRLEAHWDSMQRHLRYLRSLEDTPRVRAAGIAYMQTWLHHFYPEHRDVVAEMQAMAAELGGVLHEPTLSWKYAWIRSLFGWSAAKKARSSLPQFKASLKQRWDKVCYERLT
ncbi:MAG: glycosyltransferase family 2 protein [Verrucomicrobiales bacterium]